MEVDSFQISHFTFNIFKMWYHAIHHFKWMNIIQINKMDFNDFEILLINVTFYVWHVQMFNLVC